jgi:hypothetical protein
MSEPSEQDETKETLLGCGCMALVGAVVTYLAWPWLVQGVRLVANRVSPWMGFLSVLGFVANAAPLLFCLLLPWLTTTAAERQLPRWRWSLAWPILTVACIALAVWMAQHGQWTAAFVISCLPETALVIVYREKVGQLIGVTNATNFPPKDG